VGCGRTAPPGSRPWPVAPASAAISQMGSAPARNPAPPPNLGQSEHAFGNGFLSPRVDPGCSGAPGRSRHMVLPSRLVPPWFAPVRPPQGATLASDQSGARSGQARHRYLDQLEDHVGPCRTIRALTLTSFSRAWPATIPPPPSAERARAGSWRGCRRGRTAGDATRCPERHARTGASSAGRACPPLIHCSAVPRPL
jgi:hypothetical protein